MLGMHSGQHAIRFGDERRSHLAARLNSEETTRRSRNMCHSGASSTIRSINEKHTTHLRT